MAGKRRSTPGIQSFLAIYLAALVLPWSSNAFLQGALFSAHACKPGMTRKRPETLPPWEHESSIVKDKSWASYGSGSARETPIKAQDNNDPFQIMGKSGISQASPYPSSSTPPGSRHPHCADARAGLLLLLTSISSFSP
eukprot:749209-Hanusia_phi.AAC.1